MRGELLFRQQTKSNNINLSKLDSGMYFLTIEYNKERKTIKIIKR
jgi:hypothetical protein